MRKGEKCLKDKQNSQGEISLQIRGGFCSSEDGVTKLFLAGAERPV